MARKVKITQIRSALGRQPVQRRTVRALGIRRMHESVIHNDTPQIRGMVRRISHLLKVEEVDHDEAV